jgi:hypothetical protein
MKEMKQSERYILGWSDPAGLFILDGKPWFLIKNELSLTLQRLS